MKYFFETFLSIVFLFSLSDSKAQVDSIPIYKRFPDVPPFNIISVADSTKFSKEDLKKKLPVIIILFNPDCDHCRHFTKDLLERGELFKKMQVVMVSSMDHSLLKNFFREFKVGDHPWIKMGRDANFLLSTFYSNRSFPAVYVYNKKGNFQQAFEGKVVVNDIVAAAESK